MKYGTLLLIVTFFAGCKQEKMYKTDSAIKKEAVEVGHQLYKFWDRGEYNETHVLFNPRFFENNSTEELNSYLETCFRKLGKVQSRKLLFAGTVGPLGKNYDYHVNLSYWVKRQKYISQESVHLKSENGRIYINSMNIWSPGLNGEWKYESH